MSEIPKVEVELIETQFNRLWRIRKCPLCGEEHQHDAGKLDDDPKDYLGHVTGHCRPGTTGAARGYILVAKE